MPTATPAIALIALRMLAVKGPPSIYTKPFAMTLPWLVRFMVQSQHKHYLHNAQHLVALTKHTNKSWHNLLHDSDCEDMFKPVGWLRLFEKEASFNANANVRQMMQHSGTAFESLDSSQIHDLEPKLSAIFKHGCFQQDCHFITNPQPLLQNFTQHFVSHGGELKIAQVQYISLHDRKLWLKKPVKHCCLQSLF
jgi:D-amino-acid dehydrogenase